MSQPHETRPCPHDGCDGTQTCRLDVKGPSGGSATGDDDGNISWQPEHYYNAWVCDKNDFDHFDPEY